MYKILSHIVRVLYPRKVWQQIFLILIIFVVSLVFSLGFLLTKTSQNVITEKILTEHKHLAEHISREIEQYIDSTRQMLRYSAALLGVIDNDLWQQETAVVEMSLGNSSYRRVSILDLQGNELVTSDLGTVLTNRANEEVYKYGKLGKEKFSDIYFTEQNMPMMTFSAPIKHQGKITGVLMVDMTLKGIFKMIDHVVFNDQLRKYAVDRLGNLIVSPKDLAMVDVQNLLSVDLINKIIHGEMETDGRIKDELDRVWLVSYAAIKDLTWGVITFHDDLQILSFVRLMKTQSAFLIMISIIIALFLSLVIARILSRPIRMIVEDTNRIYQGDYVYKFKIKRRDEIGRLFFSFNRMKKKLIEAQNLVKLSAVGVAATSIAHELKNSLTLLNTYIDLVPRRHNDKKFIKEFSQIVPKEIKAWKEMLRGITDYARSAHFSFSDINLDVLLRDVALLAKLRMSQKGISFELKNSLSLPVISGNEEKLKQVFLNIISNAIEATPTGGRVSMSSERVVDKGSSLEEYVEIKIMNTGERIEDENFKKIFDPFYTTKTKGLGLGLAISQEIIHLHGGDIEVSSNTQNGAIFTIKIPVNKQLCAMK